MAKYDKDRKFYWLQLKEDFFDEDSISWIEEQENGEKYSLFYLKLCLKSLKTKGILIRKIGKMIIPYDKNTLATLTKTSADTVVVAMELFKKIGLVQILENGEIYMTQIEELIGQKSIGAFKKEQQRLLRGQKVDTGVDICPPEIEIDIEIEQELEKMDKVVEFYEQNIGLITPMEFEVYENYIKDGFKVDTIIYAMELAVKQKKRNTAYIEGILKNWERQNAKILSEAKRINNDFEEKKENKSKEKNEYEEMTFESEEDYERRVLGKGT